MIPLEYGIDSVLQNPVAHPTQLPNLAQSLREPMLVEDRRQTIAVVISAEMYERWQEMEDAFWLMKTQQAADSGFVGTDQALELLKQVSPEKGISWEEIR